MKFYLPVILVISSLSAVGYAADRDVLKPAQPVQYDSSKEFSIQSNPNSVWSYGYSSQIGGAFTLLTFPFTQPDQNGVEIISWSLSRTEQPAIFGNITKENAISDADGGHNYPPETIWVVPGHRESERYAVVRFTTPAEGRGPHSVEAMVYPYLPGPISGDTDFHVVKNDVELLGKFLPGQTGWAVYQHKLRLRAGNTIDFVVGPGEDGSEFASGLILKVLITKL